MSVWLLPIPPRRVAVIIGLELASLALVMWGSWLNQSTAAVHGGIMPVLAGWTADNILFLDAYWSVGDLLQAVGLAFYVSSFVVLIAIVVKSMRLSIGR